MFHINNRFVRQTIAAFALTVGVSTISFAQTTTSSTSTTSSTTQGTSAMQVLAEILACTGAACTGGGRTQAQ